MSLTNPLWVDITWRPGKSAQLTLEVCQHLQTFTGLDIMMHLTCNNMSKEEIDDALKKCKEYGVRNILALRGDPPEEGDPINDCGLNYGVDLVNYIKEQYGDYFCIGAAGYPETHIEADSSEQDLIYLKEKVDAGAELIITQLFFDTQIFIDFVKNWREIGIECPIIPGIMPIQSYNGFIKMTSLCDTYIPPETKTELERIKNNEAEVRAFGVNHCAKMCQEIIESGTKFLHFYTINLEKSTVDVVYKLGIMRKSKLLPWTKPSWQDRIQETVRPIFWANKPKSYIARTSEWDEYPNGRWGVSRSPAFGDISEYPSMSKLYKKSNQKLRELWGEEYESEKDIGKLIISYVEGKTKRLPWWEEKIQDETSIIGEFIRTLNQNYFFTVNSQPRANSIPSNDPIFGWGPKGGYVYQKEYIEFLVPEAFIEPLVNSLNEHSSISYQAINSKGNDISNVSSESVNAVTWGVFPCQEVVQPTVVDHTAFYIWSEELFGAIKDEWQSIYPKDSKTSEILDKLFDNYYLINIVDNDFVNGSLEKIIIDFIASNKDLIQSYCQE